MSSLQSQARALGDPTRHELFRHLADLGRPADVAELTERFGLNHNAIRQHLAKLVDAGLVIEAKAPARGRGRPRLQYEVHPGAESRWGVAGPYERLAGWLAEIVRSGDDPVEVGRRAGRRQVLGSADSGRSIEALVDQMARQGFEPIVESEPGRVDVVLTECPFESTALADPDTVCDLHLGMARGMVEGLDGVEVEHLVRRDPRQAHCRLRCRVA